MTDVHCHVSCGDAAIRELLIGRDFVGVHPWEAAQSGEAVRGADSLCWPANGEAESFPLQRERAAWAANGELASGTAAALGASFLAPSAYEAEGIPLLHSQRSTESLSCAYGLRSGKDSASPLSATSPHLAVDRLADDLRRALMLHPTLGVGEIGLDRLKERTVSPQMRAVFVAQLALAAEFRRPVVLHGAKCWGQVVAEIKKYFSGIPSAKKNCRTDKLSGLLHCQTDGSALEAVEASETGKLPLMSCQQLDSVTDVAVRQLDSCGMRKFIPSFLFHGFSRSDGLLSDIVALNGFVSVGPAVLNDHAVNYRALVKKLPLDRLVVETDRTPENAATCPSVVEVAKKVAELRGLSFEELERVTDANAARFAGMAERVG